MCPSLAKADFMFKFMNGEDTGPNVTFSFEGQTIEAPQGMSIAAALLANGITAFRQTKDNKAERGPFCLMGTCYECLVLVDGVQVQACMTQIPASGIVDRAPNVTRGNTS